MLLILGVARRCVEADQFLRAASSPGGNPNSYSGHDVSGATLGLAGFGRIARATARRAHGVRHGGGCSAPAPGDRPVGDDELGEFAGNVRHQQLARSWWNAATSCPCTSRSPTRPAIWWTQKCWNDEADCHPGQHRPRADRRRGGPGTGTAERRHRRRRTGRLRGRNRSWPPALADAAQHRPAPPCRQRHRARSAAKWPGSAPRMRSRWRAGKCRRIRSTPRPGRSDDPCRTATASKAPTPRPKSRITSVPESKPRRAGDPYACRRRW